MQKQTVLISGDTINTNDKLIKGLRNYYTVLFNKDLENLNFVVKENKINLIILELTPNDTNNIDLIAQIKTDSPSTKIILINGNGDAKLTARAFAHGINDLFHRPYLVPLLIERVKALLQ